MKNQSNIRTSLRLEPMFIRSETGHPYQLSYWGLFRSQALTCKCVLGAGLKPMFKELVLGYVTHSFMPHTQKKKNRFQSKGNITY